VFGLGVFRARALALEGLIGRKFKYFSNLMTDPCAVLNYATFEPTYTRIR